MQNKKISNFFTLNDTLKNELNIEQDYMDNKRVVNAISYCGARLDLFKFILNSELDIVNWFMGEEVRNATNTFEFSPHVRGLGVEFRVVGNVISEVSATKTAFEVIKNKLLGKNYITLSAHEIIYNETKDTIYMSFKLNMSTERRKIGVMSEGKRFLWKYMDGILVPGKDRKNSHQRKNKTFKHPGKIYGGRR